MTPLSPFHRWAILLAAFAALVFDGVELGLMPIASLSVSRDLLGEAYTKTLGGEWFAWWTASLMLGAAVGGILLGSLGDRIGRTRAMAVSVLFYSVFAGLGAWVRTQEEMLVLRFLVGLGVGGVWPNAVVLVAESWPRASRPTVAGVLGAGINVGILLLSQLASFHPITPDSWRWIFYLAAVPTVLGLVVLLLPESPAWLASRQQAKRSTPLLPLLRPPLLSATLFGVLLASIPLVGAWAASKWMLPWADAVADNPGYKATVQGWWALGATLGSFLGALVAHWLGRRLSYFVMALGSTALTVVMFQLTEPLAATFLPVVFAQGLIATLFFGWLALYLPDLFPTEVRAAGSGVAMNAGRFATAAGVLLAGVIFTALGGSYPLVGTCGAGIYALGMLAILWAPAPRGGSS